MNLKDVLNNVLTQSGFREQAGFTGASDPDTKQMVAIANRVAQELTNYYNWGVLRRDTEITTFEGQLRYQLPSDFLSFVPDSMWETDGSRMVGFPTPENKWFMYRFSPYSTGGTMQAKKYGNEIEIIDPVDGESFKFEYISKYLIESEQGERKERFTLDTDTFLLDPEVLILGVQGNWAQTKLLPQYREWMANYANKRNELIGRDAGSATVGGPASRRSWLESRQPYTPLWK